MWPTWLWPMPPSCVTPHLLPRAGVLIPVLLSVQMWRGRPSCFLPAKYQNNWDAGGHANRFVRWGKEQPGKEVTWDRAKSSPRTVLYWSKFPCQAFYSFLIFYEISHPSSPGRSAVSTVTEIKSSPSLSVDPKDTLSKRFNSIAIAKTTTISPHWTMPLITCFSFWWAPKWSGSWTRWAL